MTEEIIFILIVLLIIVLFTGVLLYKTRMKLEDAKYTIDYLYGKIEVLKEEIKKLKKIK